MATMARTRFKAPDMPAFASGQGTTYMPFDGLKAGDRIATSYATGVNFAADGQSSQWSDTSCA